MNDRVQTISIKTAAVAALAVAMCVPSLFSASTASAQTECQPDDLLCAEVRIGPGRAGVRIGGAPAPQPAPPPPVVVQPAPQPPTVVVQPAPPPPPQPRPPTVVVQQAPPPPPPQQVVVQPAPVSRRVVVRQRRRYPYSSAGIHLSVGGIFGEELGMGGVGAAFRLRPNPHFALDIGGNFYAGNDYNGMDRWQAPLEVDAMFFINPQHRFQFYALVGVGASYGQASGFNIHTRQFDSRDYIHVGGTAGLGVEWRIARWFALNFDVRGFIQQRVDDDPAAEFTELNDEGRWQQTDTSGGFTGRFGATFYWGR